MKQVTAERPRNRPSSRWYSPRRAGFWVMSPVIVCLLAGFLILPGLIRTAAEDFAANAFGLDLEIGSVRTNPITLSLMLTDLHATTPDGATVATAERIELALHPLSGVGRPWSLRPGAVHGARLHDPRRDHAPYLRIATVALGGGRYRARTHDLHFDTVELIQPRLRMHADRALPWRALAARTDAEKPALPRIDLARMRAVDLGIEIVDERLDPPARLQLDGIDLTLTDFTSDAHNPARLRMEGAFNGGGGFSLDGDLMPAPAPRLAGDIEIDGFPLWRLADWAPNLDVLSGTLFTGGQLEIGAGEPLGYQGRVDIDDLHLAAAEDRTAALRWRQLYAENMSLSLGRPRLEIATITLDAPETQIRFDAHGSVHVGPLRFPARRERVAARTLPDAATLIVGGVRVTAGRLDITDPTAEPSPLQVHLHGLNGNLTRLATGATQAARLTLSGHQADDDAVDIHGRVQLSTRLRGTEVELEIREPGTVPSAEPATVEACYRIDATGFTAACSRRTPDR